MRGDAGQGAAHRQRRGVAGEDADQRGGRGALGRLAPEAARDEGEHRFVLARRARDERLARTGAACRARRQQVGLEQRGRAGGERAQRAADVDEAPARGGRRAAATRLGQPGGVDQRARLVGPVEHRLRAALAQEAVARARCAIRPPGAARRSSSSTTSWPRAASRCAAVRPEMPPPTIVTRTAAPQAQPRARAVASTRSASAAMNAGWQPTVRARAKCTMPACCGALLVEDVDLLQRLDVLARERDRDDDDRRRSSPPASSSSTASVVGPQPALRADAALEAEPRARAEPEAPGDGLDGDADVVEVGIAAPDVRLGQPVRREQHRRRRRGARRAASRSPPRCARRPRARSRRRRDSARSRRSRAPPWLARARARAGSATIRSSSATRAGRAAARPRGRCPARGQRRQRLVGERVPGRHRDDRLDARGRGARARRRPPRPARSSPRGSASARRSAGRRRATSGRAASRSCAPAAAAGSAASRAG